MKHEYLYRWCYTFAAIATLVGCQSSEIAEPTAGESPVSVAAQKAVEPTSEATAEESAEVEPTTVASAAQFTPPFPDRTELFEPPKRVASSIRRDEEHGESVELKGFVNVDQPRAVLSIDGVISPIPEGGEKYGVQVISIQPPSVVLQRGRSRWTATLE